MSVMKLEYHYVINQVEVFLDNASLKDAKRDLVLHGSGPVPYEFSTLTPSKRHVLRVAAKTTKHAAASLKVELKWGSNVLHTFEYDPPRHLTGDFFNETVVIDVDKNGQPTVEKALPTHFIPALRVSDSGNGRKFTGANDPLLWEQNAEAVKAGEQLTITAGGSASLRGGAKHTLFGPTGEDYPGDQHLNCFVDGKNRGALVAKLGENGDPFLVGYRKTYNPRANGKLWFAVNDSWNDIHDNTGGFWVSVQRQQLDAAAYTTTVEGSPMDLPDDRTERSSKAGVVDDVTVKAVRVNLDLEHTFPRDLVIKLKSPKGTIRTLSDKRGSGRHSNGSGYRNTTFDDRSQWSINDTSSPFCGEFTPKELLQSFQGESAKGNWELLIKDEAGQDKGKLNSWTLQIDPA